MSEEFNKTPVNNFYLEPESFYVNPELGKTIGGASIRKEVANMFKLASSDRLLQLGNPLRMLVNSDEDLKIVLKLMEPPSFISELKDANEVKKI